MPFTASLAAQVGSQPASATGPSAFPLSDISRLFSALINYSKDYGVAVVAVDVPYDADLQTVFAGLRTPASVCAPIAMTC
jgi:hypothetical protein